MDLQKRILCIKARNEQATQYLRRDFETELKDVDRESAEDSSADLPSRAARYRQYETLARNLPVFCVSSDAYQTLCGNSTNNRAAYGFGAEADTGVPALLAHCASLTEITRIASCKRFLQGFARLCHSIRLEMSCESKLADQKKRKQNQAQELLKKYMKLLRKDLDNAIKDFSEHARVHALQQLRALYPRAIADASGELPSTVKSWEGSVNHYMVLRAITQRHGGPYTNPKGSWDFNRDLCTPFQQAIESPWTNLFHHALPNSVKHYITKCQIALRSFHDGIVAEAKKKNIEISYLDLVTQQLQLREDMINMQAEILNAEIDSSQKNASREFKPIITQAMTTAYNQAANECGT